MTDIFTGVGWSFGLMIDGMMFSEITKVEGIKLEADVIELKTQSLTGQYTRKKLPGRMKSGTISVTRALPLVGTTYEFTDWIQMVFMGNMHNARKTANVYVYQTAIPGFAGTATGLLPTPFMTFTAYYTWPTSIDYGSFEAGNNGTLTEKVTLHHEGLYAYKGGGGPQPTY